MQLDKQEMAKKYLWLSNQLSEHQRVLTMLAMFSFGFLVMVSATVHPAAADMSTDMTNVTTGINTVSSASNSVFATWTQNAILLVIIGLAIFSSIMYLVKGIVKGRGKRG